MTRGWLILLILVFSGCTQVQIQDHEWCGDLGPYGASCFHTLTQEKRKIDKETWDRERVGQVCGKGDAFAELKGAVLKLCRLSRKCWYSSARVRVEQFGANLDDFQKEVDALLLEIELK